MLSGQSETIYVVSGVFYGLSLMAISLRCYVRLRIVREFGWDDALMVVGMVLYTGFCVCAIMGAAYGMGQKTDYFKGRENEFRRALLLWWLGQKFYILTCLMVKISIALLLLRLAITRSYFLVLWTFIFVNMAVGLAGIILSILQCMPVSYFWERLTVKGDCRNFEAFKKFAYFYGAVAALSDLTIAVLPICLLWSLHIRRSTKYGAVCILGVGCIASTAVIARFPYLHTYGEQDILYATIGISIWSAVEAGLGLIAGSLTTLRPLFRCRKESSSDTQNQQTIPLNFPRNVPRYEYPDLQRQYRSEGLQDFWPPQDDYHLEHMSNKWSREESS